MTSKDDIIRMAREGGWMHDHDSETGFVAEAAVKFAALVAAAAKTEEREACAELCERMARRTDDIRSAALEVAAENIRARGNT